MSDHHLITHGHTSGGRSKEYRAWINMRHRCRREPSYINAGITVCDRWRIFENFLADVGLAPAPDSTWSLDRIDNTKGYEPGNCRWATWGQQSRNTRRNININGACLKDTCAALGLNYNVARHRLRSGRSLVGASS